MELSGSAHMLVDELTSMAGINTSIAPAVWHMLHTKESNGQKEVKIMCRCATNRTSRQSKNIAILVLRVLVFSSALFLQGFDNCWSTCTHALFGRLLFRIQRWWHKHQELMWLTKYPPLERIGWPPTEDVDALTVLKVLGGRTKQYGDHLICNFAPNIAANVHVCQIIIRC